MKYYYSVILCCATIIINAQNIKLADSLYQIKYNEEAELIFEQSIFENKFGVTNELIFEKALFLKQVKKYEKAKETLLRINENDLTDSFKFIYYYHLSVLNYLTDNHAEVELNINKVKYFIADSSYKNKLILLEILNLNKSRKWNEAKALLIENSKGKMDTNEINVLFKTALNYKPRKSSTAQALLTFLPGTGQVYIGKTLHGVVNATLILTGLTWGVYNVYNGYYITSVFTGFLFSYIFYNGGIAYTLDNVEKYNSKKLNNINQRLNSRIIEILNKKF
jgi:tetratricopeptide (TPR) repeat protein